MSQKSKFSYFTSRWSRQVTFDKLPKWVKRQLEIEQMRDFWTAYEHTDLKCLKFGAQKYLIPMYASEAEIDSEGVHYGDVTQVQLILIDGGKTTWLYASCDEKITSYYFSRSGKTLIVHLYDWSERRSRVAILDARGEDCTEPYRGYRFY